MPDSSLTETQPFSVYLDAQGCEHCGDGDEWGVVGPGDVAESQTWSDKDEAESIAGDLNRAFELGQQSRTSWQPIETAPKDRKFILVFGRVATQLGDRHRKKIAYFYDSPCGHWVGWDYPDLPTHWMPLPPSPEGM